MLQKMFKKREERDGFKIKYIKKLGCWPFEDLDFNEYDVFRAQHFLYWGSIHEQMEWLKKVALIEGSIEFVIVPTVLEPSKMVEALQEKARSGTGKMRSEEARRYLSYIAEKVPSESIPGSDLYAVVKKSDHDHVKSELSKNGISLAILEMQEAKSITVIYK